MLGPGTISDLIPQIGGFEKFLSLAYDYDAFKHERGEQDQRARSNEAVTGAAGAGMMIMIVGIVAIIGAFLFVTKARKTPENNTNSEQEQETFEETPENTNEEEK